MPTKDLFLVRNAMKNRTIELLVQEWSGGDKGIVDCGFDVKIIRGELDSAGRQIDSAAL